MGKHTHKRYLCKRCGSPAYVKVHPACGIYTREGKDRHDKQLCSKCYEAEKRTAKESEKQRYEIMESEIARASEAFDSLKEYLDLCKEFGKRPDKVSINWGTLVMEQTREQKKRKLENALLNLDGWKDEYNEAEKQLMILKAKIKRLMALWNNTRIERQNDHVA